VGIVAIAVGYRGPLGSIVATPVRALLGGALSPLRNVDKFEPLLRLPLAIGFGHAVSVLAARWPDIGKWRVVEIGATCLVVAAAFPLVSGGLAQPGSFARIPAYWKQTAAWLNQQGDSRTLVAPAAPFAEYTWGRPLDEPLQSLSHTSLAVRNLIPLGSDGATRLLDEISQAIDSARGDPNLAPGLARAGIGFVVIRNDLDPYRSGAPSPVYIRRTLAFSPGIRLATSFGPIVSSGMLLDRVVPDVGPGPAAPIRAVEIYAVANADGRIVSYPRSGTVTATGGAESVPSLVRTGPAKDRAVILAADAKPVANMPTVPVVTDGLQRRDVDPGLVRDSQSYVLGDNEPSPYTGKSPLQRLDTGTGRHQTVAVVVGATAIKASSVASAGERLPENQPYSAFDGDPATGWVPDPEPSPVGQWIEIDLDRSVTLPAMTVQRLTDHPGRPQITDLKVITDAGMAESQLDLSQVVQPIALPAGATRRVRLVVGAVSGAAAGTNGPGLAEVVIPGVRVDRRLESPPDLPPTAAGSPTVVLNRTAAPAFDSHRTDEESRLQRVVTIPHGGPFAMSGTAVSRPGFALTQTLDILDKPRVVAFASSTWGNQPAFAGQQAVDGNARTQWLADPWDPSPTLSVLWTEPRTIDSIRIVPAAAPSLVPVHVRLTSAVGTRDLVVLNDKPVTFPPLVTKGVNVVVVATGPNAALAQAGTVITPPAAGIGELELGGIEDLVSRPLPADQLVIPCGLGPEVTIDGHSMSTQVIGSRQDFLAANQVAVVPCSLTPLSLSSGRHVIEANAVGPVALTGLTLLPLRSTSGTSPSASAPPAVRVLRWGSASRMVEVGPGAGILATTENFNPGWAATQGGIKLQAVRVDGWRQAWILPGRAGLVTLRFTPDVTYRRALALGAVFLAVLIVMALLPGRRRVGTIAGRSVRGAGLVAMSSAVLLLLGGPIVLAVPLLLAVPRRARVLPVLAAAFVALAGVVVALSSYALPGSGAGAFGWQAQLLVLAGIAAALLAAVPERSR
jgi:arabinofuranan 3-O-arabinosyltransferase